MKLTIPANGKITLPEGFRGKTVVVRLATTGNPVRAFYAPDSKGANEKAWQAKTGKAFRFYASELSEFLRGKSREAIIGARLKTK